MSASEVAATPPSDDDERFLIELEFVQNLCNPKYLQYLAQNRYFQDETFMNFLRYLRYFKEVEYLRHLVFPQCLVFLDVLIDNPQFVEDLTSTFFVEHLHAQQGLYWQHGSAKPTAAAAAIMVTDAPP